MEFYFFSVLVGFLISLYQGYRGFVFQLRRPDRQNWNMSNTNFILLFCLADGFFYFVCAAVGCFSLALALHLIFNGPPLWEKTASTMIFVVGGIFVGVTGITGQLPHLIQKWNPNRP